MARGGWTTGPGVERGDFVLGTAQLGMRYGIANRRGQPSEADALRIVEAAYAAGVRCFDTAFKYGTAEPLLGAIFQELQIADEVRVISKLDADRESLGSLSHDIDRSLERLKLTQLSSLLLHDEDALDWWDEGLRHELVAAKTSGRIAGIGISVYTVSRALEALATAEIDCLQVPANVFDRRMSRAGVFEIARAAGKTVFVRSIFLQGLALMDSGSLSAQFEEGQRASAAYGAFCEGYALDPVRFAISHVRNQGWESPLVFGAESVDQLMSALSAFGADEAPAELLSEWDRLWPDDRDALVDVRRWPRSA